jgi:hypothetical protein
MTKPTIVTRAGKGSALTWTEGDTNLTNLRDATVTIKADTGGTDVTSDLNGTVTLVAGTNVTITGDNTAKTVTIAASGGGGSSALSGLTDVQITSPSTNQVLKYSSASSKWVNGAGGIDGVYADTNPALGGNLTVMGYSIISSSNGNINITPNGTGSIVLDGLSWPQADGAGNQVLKTDGSGQLSWTSLSYLASLSQDGSPTLGANLNTAGYDITSSTSYDITIAPGSGRRLYAKQLSYNEGPIYNLGTTGGTITPSFMNGNVQKITLNSALTFNAFDTPIAGQSLTLIIYGGTAYTSITSTMKFAGGVKTLTGTAGCIDILTVYYDGTTYFASLGKGYA